MTDSRRRRKRSASSAHAAPAAQAAAAVPVPAAASNARPTPMPDWRWKTFPVYFAFAVGGFIGLYMGLIAGATDNTVLDQTFFIFWAILLGFGFSRFTTRWIVSRQWARRRSKQTKR